MSDREDFIDALAHLGEELSDNVRLTAIKTGRTVRTTPKPKDKPKGGKK